VKVESRSGGCETLKLRNRRGLERGESRVSEMLGEGDERRRELTLSGALEGVDDVERGDGLALGVLSVGDRVADDVW